MRFPVKASQFSAALPRTTNFFAFPGFSPYLRANQDQAWESNERGQNNEQELLCGWHCQGMDKGRWRGWKGGGKDISRPVGRQDLSANGVKHRTIQAPVKCREKGWRSNGYEGKGMNEGNTKKKIQLVCIKTLGEKWKEEQKREGWQMPQSRPSAQEIIHIGKHLLPAPTVHLRADSELFII